MFVPVVFFWVLSLDNCELKLKEFKKQSCT